MTTQPSIWQRSAIRSVEPGHRQATWAELFFDVIFVVAVAQLAAFLTDIEETSLWSSCPVRLRRSFDGGRRPMQLITT